MSRRVVITGCGIISPLGCTPELLREALRAGRSGVTRLTLLPTAGMPAHAGGEVASFTGQIEDFGPLDPTVKKAIRKGLKVMCREIQMGVAAAQLALHDSALPLGQVSPDRVGCVFGSDYIMTLPEEFAAGVRACRQSDGRVAVEDWPAKGMAQVTPLWLLKYLPNMPACHVAIYNDLRGPNNSLTVREASANLAVAEAQATIARGAAEMVLTGATGSRIHPLRTVHTLLQEEVALGSQDPGSLSRPFDRERAGMVVGEGAAALMLEELATAEQRGARILAEIVGHGASAVLSRDGVADRTQALVNAMRRALAMAQMTPGQVGHIHAHGLSTRLGDIAEAQAIQIVFGADAERVPVVAAKSYFGNLGAASGMVELAASLSALADGELFATLNYETPDPECPVNLVTRGGVPSGDSVLNLNVTPQGQAAAVLVRRWS